MGDEHIRMIIEFDVDQEALDEHGLSANDVFKHLTFCENDTGDGFRISTNIPGMNPASNFFLCDGKVVSQEFIANRSKGDGLDNWRRMVRDELDINSEVHNISSDDEKNALLASEDVIDQLAKLMEIRMQRGDRNEYDALEIVFQQDFPEILFEFREGLLENLRDELTDIINEREDDDIDYRRALWLDERYLEIDSEIQALNALLQVGTHLGQEKVPLSDQIQFAASRAEAIPSISVVNTKMLCESYNRSDLEALLYLKEFCVGNDGTFVNDLINANLKFYEGSNRETSIRDESEYHDKKWVLFGKFGVTRDFDDQMIPTHGAVSAKENSPEH